MPEECIAEMKVKNNMLSCSISISLDSGKISELIDYKQLSTLQRLLRVTAYVRKFVQCFKAVIKGNKPVTDWKISVADVKQAELDWILGCDKECVIPVTEVSIATACRWEQAVAM